MKKQFKVIALSAFVMGSMGVSTAMASTAPVAQAKVTTIADITVSQTTPMSFGSDIIPTTGTICELVPVTTATANPTTATNFDISNTWNWTTGRECGLISKASGGVFDISGAQDQTVQVSLAGPADKSAVIFTPAVVFVQGASTVLSSTLIAPGSAPLALAELGRQDLSDASLAQGVVLDGTGKGSLLIGGSLEVVALDAGLSNQSLSYTVTVTY